MTSRTTKNTSRPNGDDPSQQRLTSTKARPSNARISAACEACKRRKTKCTGGPPPCKLCTSLNTECVIDVSLDMRRRAALQRTIDESKTYQDSLNTLVDCIRDGNPSLRASLAATLRGTDSQDEIIQVIQQFAHMTRSPESEVGGRHLDHGSSLPLSPTGSVESASYANFDSSSISTSPGKGRGQPGQNHFDARRLLHRLRTCSEEEGTTILNGLTSLPDPAASGKNVPGNLLGSTRKLRPAEDEVESSDDRSRRWHSGLDSDGSPDDSRSRMSVESQQRRSSMSTTLQALNFQNDDGRPKSIVDPKEIPLANVSHGVYFEDADNLFAETSESVVDLCVAQSHTSLQLRIPLHKELERC